MRRLTLLFGAASLAILAFMAIPFASLALSVKPGPLSFALASREALEALALTLTAATLATLILLILGVPLAYLLARFKFRGKEVVEAIVDLPLIIPHAVVGVVLLAAYGPKAPLGELLKSLGVVVESSTLAVVAVFVFIGAPLLIDAARDGFVSIDPYLEGVARSMGAGPLRTFISVSLPLAARSIATGATLAWARAVSEVGALLIIAYYPKTIGVLVVEWFSTYGLPYAAALTVILLSLSAAVMLVLKRALRWRG
jgi:molybdate/tungstate transport system permease protein